MYRINLSNHEENITIPLMQYDSNYEVRIAVEENLKYKTVYVDVETSLGNVLHCPADTIDDRIVRFWVDTQISWKAGKYKAQIIVYNQDDLTKVVSYYPVFLKISPSVKTHYDDPYETAKAEVDKLINEGYKWAESWAHGETGKRDGENTDNAKYWSTISNSWAKGGTGRRVGEDTDNAKYYSEIAKSEYKKIEDTTEAKLSARISALETGKETESIVIGTIDHEMNCYPTVDLYLFDGGAGCSSVENVTCGGTSLVHVMCSYEHTDMNHTKVSASPKVLVDSNGVSLTVDQINKVRNGQYAVVFKDSVRTGALILR